MTGLKEDRRRYALSLLARMIVRAYLGEVDRGEAGPNAYKDQGEAQLLNHSEKTKSEGRHE